MNLKHTCDIENLNNLVKPLGILHAQARKAVASPFAGFSTFAFATARA